ncbi:MAG: hypothetical protein K0M69_16695 [Youngiibacter sp.]|nr:hypothetical protein [Youngiibacter sp.]
MKFKLRIYVRRSICIALICLFILTGCGSSAPSKAIDPNKNDTQSAALPILSPIVSENKTSPSQTQEPTQASTQAPTQASTQAPTAAPTPAPTESPAPTEPEGTIVYITETGEKYHKGSCRFLSKSKIEISLEDAVKNGYEPCSVCKP